MSRSVVYMSMSLDGYIAGPKDNPRNPGGDNFIRRTSGSGLFRSPVRPRSPSIRRGLANSSSTR